MDAADARGAGRIEEGACPRHAKTFIDLIATSQKKGCGKKLEPLLGNHLHEIWAALLASTAEMEEALRWL